MKRLLLIMNPCSGTKKANPLLAEMLSMYGRAGYECLVFMTQKRGDGVTLAAQYAAAVDLIVCVGGDGTFNEVISGVCASGCSTKSLRFSGANGSPASIRSAATRKASSVMLLKLKFPVSVAMAAYRQEASSRSRRTSSAAMSCRTMMPAAGARPSTQLMSQ